jgi:hypothetical protein
MMSLMKSKIKYLIVTSIVYLFISSNQFSPLNPIVYETRLWLEDTLIFSGIRISEEQGLGSYGGHAIGLVNKVKSDYSSQDLENNYYSYHLKINKDYLDKKIDLETSPEIELYYYDRNTGFAVRLIPYLIYKTNIFNFTPSTYVENIYFILTSLLFGFMLKKIHKKEGFLVSFIFGLSHFLYWIFIIHTRSFATPYLVCIFPFFITYTKFSKYIFNKKYNYFFITLIFLIPFLEHITVGYLHVFSLLTGIYLNNNKEFLFTFIKENLVKLATSLFSALFISQFIVFLQDFILAGQSIRYTLESHWYNLTKRNDGEGEFYCYGDSSYYDVLEMYLGSNIINLNLFELSYFNLTIISIIIYLFSKLLPVRLKPTTSESLGFFMISLIATLTWFLLTKSHALCHPHFQPMLFLYSTFPLIIIFYGRLFNDYLDYFFQK